MKRRSRGSVSTPTETVLDVAGRAAAEDRPLGFAMVDTFRVVVVLPVMTLPVLSKLGYCSVP
jgi:hypothetical protein